MDRRRRISQSQVVALFLFLDATLAFLYCLLSGARLSLLILTELALSLAYLLIAILVIRLLKSITCDRRHTLLSNLIRFPGGCGGLSIARCKSIGPENPVMSYYIQSSENDEAERRVVVCGECAACLNKFGEVDVCRVWGRCGHVFHEQCAEAWLSRNAACPTCRGHVRMV